MSDRPLSNYDVCTPQCAHQRRISTLETDLELVTRASTYNCDIAEQALADMRAAQAERDELQGLLQELAADEGATCARGDELAATCGTCCWCRLALCGAPKTGGAPK